MMLTSELLLKLKGRTTYSLPRSHSSPKEKLYSLFGKVRIVEGKRHENLAEAEILLQQVERKKLQDFNLIFMVIRNPYDYEVSLYSYLRNNEKHQGQFAKLARLHDFENYLALTKAQFPLLPYVLHQGRKPNNMELIKYEELNTNLNSLLKDYIYTNLKFNNIVNASARKDYRSYVNKSRVERMIYNRNKYLFDEGYYRRII